MGVAEVEGRTPITVTTNHAAVEGIGINREEGATVNE